MSKIEYRVEKELRVDHMRYLLLIFFAGCIIGWIYEEIFYWITEGLLRNRGILYGPWLPIYGIGALGIYSMKPLKKHPVLLFFLCAVVTGVVEYIIGVVGIHLFGMRLWDYRGLLLNLDGIICLRSVMSLALMGLQGEFCRYFSGEDPDPQRDLLTVGSASLVMSDEEMIDFLTAYGELIQKYMPNKPGEGRKVRKVTVVVSPNE